MNREWLDEAMPIHRLGSLASKEVGEELTPENCLGVCLRWLAQFVEGDRWPRPPWKEFDPIRGARHETVYSIRFLGLDYKDNMSYLTAEGWPMDTTCWYVTIEMGHRDLIIADEIEHAVMRAVIFAAYSKRFRDIAPEDRPKYGLKQLIEDGVAAS